MAKKDAKKKRTIRREKEVGIIRKTGRQRVRVALVYPNRYHVGMSNLGYQAVYRRFNEMEAVACERAFTGDESDWPTERITTVESRRPIDTFDIIAFSVSFENDYPNLLKVLDAAGLPLRSHERKRTHPLVLAGGVACCLNPEPLAPFIDCFLIGEAEGMLEGFMACLLESDFPGESDRAEMLARCARRVPGTYAPGLYQPEYHPDGPLAAFKPQADVPATIRRTYLSDLSATSTCSVIVTPNTTFDQQFLIEVGRGCPHGCRFCSAGFVYRPPRFRPLKLLQDNLQKGRQVVDAIGLVGAAVSDLPDIKALCRQALREDTRISFSSLRADALDEDFLAVLRHSKVKTATIAPDAGSERMRRVINKGLTAEEILRATELLVTNGIPNLKLYFMVGLPTETLQDVDDIVGMVKHIKHVFLQASRDRRRIGEITVSLNCFVPKPVTPFQWVAMDDTATLKHKIKRVKDGLRKVPNVRVHADIPRWAYLQALLSRGDRRVAEVLTLAHHYRGNWPRTLKETPLNPDFYVLRRRPLSEILPWDFIDHGLRRSFLIREYERAMQGRTTPPCPMKPCEDCGICRALPDTADT